METELNITPYDINNPVHAAGMRQREIERLEDLQDTTLRNPEGPFHDKLTTKVETTQVEENKSVSIFGDLDMDKVPDDPFAIDPKTYRAVVVDADVKTTTKDGEEQKTFVIKYAIDEPGDDFHGDNVWDRYGMWPGVKWENLTPAQKKTTKFFKQRLREGMDMTQEEINNFSDPSVLVDKVVYITVVQNEARDGSRKKFNNVRTAVSERLYVEQGGTTSDQASVHTGASVGL